ncbi:MAG: phage tail sheath C-terminal domain-containing protein [Bacteroidota bacterium]
MAEIILPGTYVTVRDEALISAGRVVTGNIGIVGTANKGPLNEVQILGSFSEARELFGSSDPWRGGSNNELTLIRALEQIYNNGGKTVYAVRTSARNGGGIPLATAATYDIQSSSAGPVLTTLSAKSAGTWGTGIRIKVMAAPSDQNSFVVEELTGSATALRRNNIDQTSDLNSISVQKDDTGQLQRFTVIYTGTPAVGEVQIDPSNGNLTFEGTQVPVAADTIFASYEVLAANTMNVEISSGQILETYYIADVAHLAEQVVANSSLVTADSADADDPSLMGITPIATVPAGLLFSGGSDGANAIAADYQDSVALLENEIINIVLLAGQDESDAGMRTALSGHINATNQIQRERIGLMGSALDASLNAIAGHALNSDRIIYVAPGIKLANNQSLPGAYTAAAVAGLISSLPVQTSPTNKVLNVPDLENTFSTSQLEKLVLNRVLTVEKREGFRIVKGITTSTNSAWHQITTRRIVDFATYGVRSGCNPYIGKLNNERVRGAMKATLDAFLTRMVDNEALISYELEVSATRAQQIAGEAIVTMTIRPTFSIDFIKVTMYLG